MTRRREPPPPLDPLIQIDVKVALPRKVAWMLAGAAIANLNEMGSLLEKISHVLQALPG